MILPAFGRTVPVSGPARIAQSHGPYARKTGQTGQTGQRVENAQELGALSGRKPRSHALKLASGTVHRRIPVARDVSRPIGAAHAGPQGGAPQP
jgi:hypothetical protein